MALSIPNRKKPGENSFPTEPGGVQNWLTSLVPITGMDNVRALYRGLKHSNRLETSNRNRIEIANLFAPVADDAAAWLCEQFVDQSLPLPKKSKLCFQLVIELLKELAFTYKIIVNDTYNNLLPDPSRDRALSIHRSLATIARLIECHLCAHMEPPPRLLCDANTLYGFAVKSKLTDANTRPYSGSDGEIYDSADRIGIEHSGDSAGSNGNIEEDMSVESVYILIQLLALSSPFTIRQRQIPLLCRFLSKHSGDLRLQTSLEEIVNKGATFSIHPEQDSRPQPLRYTGLDAEKGFFLLDTKPLLDAIKQTTDRTSDTTSALFEAETLSRATLSELRESLVRKRGRKSARAILRKQMHAKTGIKEITASLHYNPLNIPTNADTNPASDETSHYWPRRPENQERAWTVINENRLGACLEWCEGSTTESEIGEVVALRQVNAEAEESWVIGFVRWIKQIDLDRIQLGIKYFAKHAEPIVVNNREKGAPDISRECLLAKFSINNQELISLITPPLAFHESEVLQTGQNTQHQLDQKIASTPMCDVFIVNEVPLDDELDPETLEPQQLETAS